MPGASPSGPRAERKEASVGAVASTALRLRCWIRLAERTMSPIQLSKEFGVPLNNINYHVKELLDIGAIELVRKRPVRGAVQNFYRSVSLPVLDEEEIKNLTVEEATATARVVCQISIADMENALDKGTFAKRAEHAVIRVPMTLDEQGWQEISSIIVDAYTRVEQTRVDSELRLAEKPHRDDSIRATILLYAFETPHVEVRDRDEDDAQ